MFGTIFFLFFSELIQMWNKDLLFQLFYLYSISLLSFIFLRKELKTSFHLFLFCFFLLLMIDFLFSKKKALRNLMQIFFVVIVLFFFSLNNLASQLNITNQKFFIFLDLLQTSILPYLIQNLQVGFFFIQKRSRDILASSLIGN